MDERILAALAPITAEEQAILDGRQEIDREIYMQGAPDVVNSGKLLSAGKLITLRPNTRFVHFPEHGHDYVELMYVCRGSVTHRVDGKELTVEQGELLFLGPAARHEVCKSGQSDIAVNFIVLPEFFSTSLSLLEEEETPLRRFLVDCLCGQGHGSGYLHFRVAEVLPVQNLVENLLWSLLFGSPNRRKLNQTTMALLFLQLSGYTERLSYGDDDDRTVFQLLRYVEDHYADGSLTEAAEMLHYDLYSLSREVKRRTGRTYTELVQEKRMAQAAFLLANTDRNVDEIAASVGYENVSYFHRVFRGKFSQSPRQYRVQKRA